MNAHNLKSPEVNDEDDVLPHDDGPPRVNVPSDVDGRHDVDVVDLALSELVAVH